jgi:hypothetical protein
MDNWKKMVNDFCEVKKTGENFQVYAGNRWESISGCIPKAQWWWVLGETHEAYCEGRRIG